MDTLVYRTNRWLAVKKEETFLEYEIPAVHMILYDHFKNRINEIVGGFREVFSSRVE